MWSWCHRWWCCSGTVLLRMSLRLFLKRQRKQHTLVHPGGSGSDSAVDQDVETGEHGGTNVTDKPPSPRINSLGLADEGVLSHSPAKQRLQEQQEREEEHKKRYEAVLSDGVAEEEEEELNSAGGGATSSRWTGATTAGSTLLPVHPEHDLSMPNMVPSPICGEGAEEEHDERRFYPAADV